MVNFRCFSVIFHLNTRKQCEMLLSYSGGWCLHCYVEQFPVCQNFLHKIEAKQSNVGKWWHLIELWILLKEKHSRNQSLVDNRTLVDSPKGYLNFELKWTGKRPTLKNSPKHCFSDIFLFFFGKNHWKGDTKSTPC